jgi:uncharacterized protein (TIGR00251 family)
MLEVAEGKGHILLKVRLQPGASANALAGEFGGALKMKVTAPPERGKANRAAVGLLAKLVGVKKSAVAIVRGGHSKDKLFSIRGLRKEELFKRLGL